MISKSSKDYDILSANFYENIYTTNRIQSNPVKREERKESYLNRKVRFMTTDE